MGNVGREVKGRIALCFAALLLCIAAAPVLADSPPAQPPETVVPEPGAAPAIPLPTNQEMAETLAQFKRQEIEKEERLESPAAVHEREASQEAYVSLAPSQAEQLLSTQFAEQLQTLNAEPARFLSEAEIDRPLGETAAVVTSEGHKQLLEGTEPIRTTDAEGNLAKINLTLERTAAGYEPINPEVDVSIPQSAEEGVEVGSEGLQIAPAGVEEESEGRPFGEMEVFYPEAEEDTDLLVAPISTGVELFDQLRSKNSPETLRFQVQLPTGASLRAHGGAAEIVGTDGSLLAEVPPPSAVDSQGTEVPVQMQVEGDSLVLSIAHRQTEYAYPILVDPILQEAYWQNWNEGHNLQLLEDGAWHWNTSEGPSSSYVYGSTHCIYTCWGSGRGLYMDTPNGNLPANRWGQWSYSAPNAETYLSRAWISPLWRDDHVNCSDSQYHQPYDYVGMWIGPGWNSEPLYNESTKYGNDQGAANLEYWGNALIIGMGTSSGISIPCWRDIMAGGTAIWLEDLDRPSLSTSSTAQWTDKSPIRLNVSASDNGLGVQKFKATATNASGGGEEWWTNNSCSGLYEAPCPHVWNLGESSQPQLNYSPASLPEGIDKLSVTAYDALEKPSWYTNEMTLRVDHSAPTIALSGTLTEQEKLGAELPNYTIRAEAKDGNPESENPAEARSGLKSITFEENGVAVTPTFTPTCAGEEDCGGFKELQVPAHEMSPGPHTLVIKATDALNHVAVSEAKFTVSPDKVAPALTTSGMPGTFAPTFSNSFGGKLSGPGNLAAPNATATDSAGNVWVADAGHNRVQEFNSKGEFVQQFGAAGTGNGQFTSMHNLAINQSTDNLYVAAAERIQEFNSKGEYLRQWGKLGKENGQFGILAAVALDPEGHVWTLDTGFSGLGYEPRLQEFSSEGTYMAKFEYTEGTATGQLKAPSALAIDTKGNFWIVDNEGKRLEEFNSKGEYVRVAGAEGTENGQFKSPKGIATDASNNIWVADTGNNRIEEFSADGSYLNQIGSPGNNNGQFAEPKGVVVGANGNIWVADTGNNRIEKWLIQAQATGKNLASVTASATDANTGVTSLAVTLTNEAQKTTLLEQKTQTCPKGACSLSNTFSNLYVPEEEPYGLYVLTVEAKDAAGNVSRTSRFFTVDPGPPSIALSGKLAERANMPLNASSGELGINASETDLASSGVKTINVELEHQRVATHSFNCSSGCQEVSTSYHYSVARDGAERSRQAAAIPTGATLTNLTGVSCISANNCQAAGYYKNSSGTFVTLAESWNGTEWTVQSTPNPGGALESRLEAISCASSTNCMAIGYYKTGSEAFSTLVEHYNGTAWAIQSSPNTAGFAKNYLYSVSCGSSSDCWSVGKSAHTVIEELEGKKPAALLEHWNGSAWSLSSLTEAPAQLKRVSCGSASSCVAVTGQAGLAVQRWNGTTWASQTLATPPSGSGSTIKGISCGASGTCTAVGSYTSSGHSAPLVERWNGSSWSVQAAVDPVGVIEETISSSLEAVSCTSSACTAVGTRTSSHETSPLLESWEGAEWALQPVSAPSEVRTANLVGVSCAGEFECATVGSDTSSATQALIEKEARGKGSQTITVEAVDTYGNAESKSIMVNVADESAETPECNQEPTSVAPKSVESAAEAVGSIEKALPTAVASSKPMMEEVSGEEVDPSYSAPKPNLESEGNLAQSETSVTPEGGFTLAGIACVSPAETTSAATEAKVANGDSAVFANTAPEIDTVIRPSAVGTTIVQALGGASAPTSISWNITLNPGESLVELPSGAVAITRAGSAGKANSETGQKVAPEGLESAAALNDAAAQLEVAQYQMITADSETSEEVIAVIPRPWLILAQGSIIPLKMEVQQDVQVPVEYTMTFEYPPFELNFTPEDVVTEAVVTEPTASASAVVNERCLESGPCGVFDSAKAARYAEYWGTPPHDRNHYYWNWGEDNCTNFLSQIVARGGMNLMRAYDQGDWRDGYWWYRNLMPNGGLYWNENESTESWRVANELPRHLWQYGLAVIDSSNEPSGWTQGDILAENWYRDGKGEFNHLQFVVGTQQTNHGREPLVANESEPEGANYGAKPWARVKERIAEENPEGWNRVPLAVKHTVARWWEKIYDPANLYGPSGVFGG
jgi:sugar lactone lactonase YvrE